MCWPAFAGAHGAGRSAAPVHIRLVGPGGDTSPILESPVAVGRRAASNTGLEAVCCSVQALSGPGGPHGEGSSLTPRPLVRGGGRGQAPSRRSLAGPPLLAHSRAGAWECWGTRRDAGAFGEVSRTPRLTSAPASSPAAPKPARPARTRSPAASRDQVSGRGGSRSCGRPGRARWLGWHWVSPNRPRFPEPGS